MKNRRANVAVFGVLVLLSTTLSVSAGGNPPPGTGTGTGPVGSTGGGTPKTGGNTVSFTAVLSSTTAPTTTTSAVTNTANIVNINALLGTIGSGTTFTPVDQNQLNGQGLINLVKGPPSVKLKNPESLSQFKDFVTLLKGIPTDATDSDPAATFDQIAADLCKQAGHVDLQKVETVTTLKMGEEGTPSFAGATPTLVVQADPNAHVSSLRLVYQNPETGEVVDVKGNNMQVDDAHGTIEVDLGATSTPSTGLITGCAPVHKPVLIAGLLDGFAAGDMLAVASDSVSIPGYLTHDIKHSEVFVLAKKPMGFYYSNEPSLLANGMIGNDSVTVCDTGALLGESEGKCGILDGRSLLMTGGEEVAFTTPGAELSVPAAASVLVEYKKAGGESKISLVAQRANEPVMLKTAVGRPLYLDPGKTISIYQDMPFLKHFKLVTKSGADVPMKVMLKKIERFNPQSVEQGESPKFAHVVDVRSQQPNEDPMRVARDGRVLWTSQPLRILAAQETIFSLDRSQLSMQIGEMYLHTSSPVGMKTDLGELNAKPQADFVVSLQTGMQRIDVLSGPGLVTMNVGKHSASLNPGQELLATTRGLNQKVLLPSDGVARRQFKHVRVGYTDISTCDFSIPTILRTTGYLQAIRHPRNQLDGVLRNRLLKTACAVTYATSGRGTYLAP